MDVDIIDAIKYLTSNSNSIQTASLGGIYDYLRESNQSVPEDRYLEAMHDMELKGSIYKKENCYAVNESILSLKEVSDEDSLDFQQKDTVTRDIDVMDIIKDNLCQERERYQKEIDYLKEEIDFFKEELQQKNSIIKMLIKQNAINDVMYAVYDDRCCDERRRPSNRKEGGDSTTSTDSSSQNNNKDGSKESRKTIQTKEKQLKSHSKQYQDLFVNPSEKAIKSKKSKPGRRRRNTIPDTTNGLFNGRPLI